MWFYDLLNAHHNLLKLQVRFRSILPLMESYGAFKKVSRGDRAFYEVSKRHIRNSEPSVKEMRIIEIYQDDIGRICTKPVTDFIWALERGDMINRARNIIKFRSKKNSSDEKQYIHFADYLLHSYDIVQEYYLKSEMVEGFEKTLNIVVAFDAVTNTLHHSFAACIQIARCFPITGNIINDAFMMNNIVKFDIMSGDIIGGKLRLSEYINGDTIPPKPFASFSSSLYLSHLKSLIPESLDDPNVIELIQKRRNLF